MLDAAGAALLNQFYRDLLGRAVDPVGRAAWGGLLQQGATPADVALGIQDSVEFRTNQVRDLYAVALDRTPDPLGLNTFVPYLGQGGTIEQVAALVLGSPEFYGLRAGGTVGSFLTVLYRGLLGRNPDAAGGAAFQAGLLAGMRPGDVAAAFFASPEWQTSTLGDLYQRFLGRDAEAAGWSAWVGWWQGGASACQVVAGLLGSAEYQQRAATGGGGDGDGGGAGTLAALGPIGIDLSSMPGVCAIPVPTLLCTYIPVIPRCGCAGDSLRRAADGTAESRVDAGAGFSGAGIRYADGSTSNAACDLRSDGFGRRWGRSRTWSNAFTPSGFNGNGWTVSQEPYLVQDPFDGSLVVVLNSLNLLVFDLAGSDYVPRYYVGDQLTYDDQAGTFTLTDTLGDRLVFHDFGVSLPSNQQGRLQSFADPNGNVTEVTDWTTDGKPADVQTSGPSGADTVTESFLYTYLSTGPNSGLVGNVTLRRKVNSGSWSTVRQVDYAYDDGLEAHGNLGDLKTAVVKDGAGTALDTWYYRYYVSEEGGYQGGLKYSFSPASFARLAAAAADPEAADDQDVAPYADAFYEYHGSTHQVTRAVIQGAGCTTCSGGQGEFTYSYDTSTNDDAFAHWKYKTSETLPDGSTTTVYSNYVGQPLLQVFAANEQQWLTFWQYDSAGRQLLKAHPSAVSGFDEEEPDLLHSQTGNLEFLRDDAGLIEGLSYYTDTDATETTAGSSEGYYEQAWLQRGETGDAVPQQTQAYFAHDDGGR